MTPSQVGTPLVSVIIPVYNGANFIGEAIESVLKQTYSNWEIIVIDDGSTDNLLSVLEPSANKIKYFKQTNQGLAAARNTGLTQAQGKYIQFLDADDLIASEKLSQQVAYLEHYLEYDLVYSEVLHFTDNKSLAKRFYFYTYQGEALPEMLKFHYPAIHSPLFKKSIINSIGGFDSNLRWAEDWDLWLRLGIARAKFGHIAGDFAWCRINTRPDRLSDNKYQLFSSCLDVFKKNLAGIKLNETKINLLKKLEGYLYLRLGLVVLVNNYQEGKSYLDKAIDCHNWSRVYMATVIIWCLVKLLPRTLVVRLVKLITDQSVVYKLKHALK